MLLQMTGLNPETENVFLFNLGSGFQHAVGLLVNAVSQVMLYAKVYPNII